MMACKAYILIKHVQIPITAGASVTTAGRLLCRVQLHSAKKALHSAKPLPSAALGISLHGKGLFAECRMSGTRQRISRVPRRHSAKKSRRDGQVTVTVLLPSATRRHSAKKCVFYFFKKNALPSACIWHSAKLVFFFLDFLCRVL